MEIINPLPGLLSPTNIIIGITLLVSFYAFNNQRVLRQLIMNPYQTKINREYYRFLTSGFIHNDHMHLAFNMVSLYFFGSVMERLFVLIFGGIGTVYYILLYVLGIIVSDIPTYFKHQSNPGYNALGASGGVAAVIFAFILFLPLEKIDLFFFVPIPGFILGTLYVLYSYFQGRKSNDNINHDAHLYGAIFGVIFCSVLYPAVIPHFFQQIMEWRAF
jgi:membrane associated rhomboid family serine protease